jgi:hypothetical protein
MRSRRKRTSERFRQIEQGQDVLAATAVDEGDGTVPPTLGQ